ncbi:MAG: HAMP domain-containing sensor histidine kinase, partial [Acidimicrobiales bacterium]|nr:HAMP domain-containing sensor histidine kinase [Acidimicrobiales bacterium]
MLLLPLITVLAVGYGAFALYVEASVRSDLIGTVDDELDRAVLNPPRPGPSVPDVGGETPIQALLDADGANVADPGTMPDEVLSGIVAAELPSGTHTVSVGGQDLRVLVRPGPGGQRQVAALGVATVLDSIGDLRRTLAVGGVALVAAQVALVWFVTRRATRPVIELASTARRVAAGEHDVEVRVSPGAMETEELAHDLAHMLHELRQALADQAASTSDATQARETMARFLADAAHELRTPLTALRGYTELYEREMLDEPGALDRAMRRIGDESDRLERLVSSLLELARGTERSDRDHRPVD